MRRQMRLSMALRLLLLSVLIWSPATHAQIRTILVSPVPGDPVASGNALRAAIASISSPSAANRWLVRIEPGIYDVGSVSLQMRSWVDIEGSGINTTMIRGSVSGASLASATVNGASNAELRLLTVLATGSASAPYSIAMYNENASALRLYRIKLVAQSAVSGGSAWGMRNVLSAPLIEECEVAVSATSVTYGLVYQLFVASGERSTLLRSKIYVSSANANYGIFMGGGQTLTEIRDTRIDSTGGATTYGVYATGPDWQGTESLAVRNSEVNSGGGSTSSYGIWLGGGATVVLDVNSSRIWGHVAPATYGVFQGASVPMGFQGASIYGLTKTIESPLGNVSVASSLLYGGPVSVGGWKGCMGVWDETGTFFANTCPP